jgi:uncharacterized ferritin-like protein (DUF455 family)
MTANAPSFGDTPQRDARFEVREYWHEAANLPQNHPGVNLEFLLRQLNEELNAMEIAARNLVDFPDEDWNLRMALARQCSDEARHAIAFRRLLEARGGSLSDYPVLNFQFRIMTSIPCLIGRLAVSNRSFEASGIDAISDGIQLQKRKNDAEFVALFDQQLADEVQHVRFANVWIRKMVERDGPKAVIALARSIAHADAAFKEIVGENVVSYPVADDIRREAGFTEDEIRTAHEFAERK